MKNTIWTILKYLIALFLIFGGVQHLRTPEFYLPFVPDFISFKMLVIYASGIVEIVLGGMVFIKKYAYWGMFGIFVLMIVFLPIHVWDIFSDTPAIGSTKAAYIRLPVQFLLIWLTWKLSQRLKK